MIPRLASAAVLPLAAGMQAAFAGNHYKLDVLGFSPDGRYFAFEQHAELDAGAGYSSITSVIEVAADTVVKNISQHEELDCGDDKSRKTCERTVARIFRTFTAKGRELASSYGVVKRSKPDASIWKAEDRRMWQHYYSWWRPHESDRPSGVVLSRPPGASINLPVRVFGTESRLVLTQGDGEPRNMCDDERKATIFTLTLDRKGYKPVQLARDKSIPDEDECPYLYGLGEAHAQRLANGDIALAVVVQSIQSGWEVPDHKFFAVTALIPRSN